MKGVGILQCTFCTHCHGRVVLLDGISTDFWPSCLQPLSFPDTLTSSVKWVPLVLEALEFFDENLGAFWHSSLQKLSGPFSGSSWLLFIWVPKVPFFLALPVLCIFAFSWNLTFVFNTLFISYVGIGAIAPVRRVGDSLPESALSLYLSSRDPV